MEIWMMRKTKMWLPIIVWLLILIIGGYRVTYANLESNYDYTLKTEFTCGHINVEVNTHCIYEEDLPPFCISDKQLIFLKTNGNVKQIVSSSPRYKGEKNIFLDKEKVTGKEILQYLIATINCYKSKFDNRWYIEFVYYRGGNCEQCEYYELYNEKGQLIAINRERKIFNKLKLIYINSKDIELRRR